MRARLLGVAALLVLAACAAETPATETPRPAPASGLQVEEVAGGLEHGWDIGFLPDGQVLVTQRPGRISLISGTSPGATVTEVAADLDDVHVRGEGGLMGMVVHPDFARTRRFTTCQTYREGDEPVDVRLVTWTLAPDGRSATRVANPLTGLPVNDSGRHSGCRPTIAADGALLVGTGDTADDPTIPQDRHSPGGKVLRIDLDTGAPLPDNPFAGSAHPAEQRIYTYGHRNVQGVAVHPETGQVFTSEHGPVAHDELNLLRPGGNYGWDPSRGGTVDFYDERVPMTDLERFPDAVRELWTSGTVTEAPCGTAFLTGSHWGPLENRLAMVALRGQKLLLFTLDDAGAVTEVTMPPEFDDRFGRLRAARSGPDGALYVTTSNGEDDKLLRVTPA
ncbi:Glucose/arabinose dehydrogenase, beta-propeller fold [Amycolatopsis arida]|uniref:Glucose/arabinose dehydrogenase, beta-propeller fold n=1 Tax=Amycolatopsis arida TaxID=587909 RepID=A0A1I5Q1V2_9PSEU|nr:PQQ-dependent sugar dehydrogenase [Amycolatopsis arida]TDX98677.1 glucose/arabinose dehydrogenase [Amycolatopsis arida]SFP39856.1 Glucose/arabinose dehydrogenase, beta-propeller fold [Amycolatopsis arida]